MFYLYGTAVAELRPTFLDAEANEIRRLHATVDRVPIIYREPAAAAGFPAF